MEKIEFKFEVLDTKGKTVMKTSDPSKIPSDFILNTYEKCGFGMYFNGLRVGAKKIIEVRQRASSDFKRDTSEED